MNKDDWPVVHRMLRAGWPGEIDEAAYLGMLVAYSTEDVKNGINSMLGILLYLPKVSEIIAAIKRQKQLLPTVRLTKGLYGEAAIRRVGPVPWLVDGRRFFPVVDSALLVDRKDGEVVSCSGHWDEPDGDHMVWESWNTLLIGAAKVAA